MYENRQKCRISVLAKIDHFWHFWWTFVHSKCKRSSLRSQCWMRLFWRFSNTVKVNWPSKQALSFKENGRLERLNALGSSLHASYVMQQYPEMYFSNTFWIILRLEYLVVYGYRCCKIDRLSGYFVGHQNWMLWIGLGLL